MNNTRRKVIRSIIEMLNDTTAKVDEAKELTTNVAGEERESFDNMPEGLQESERGQRIEECADELEDIECELDDILSNIEDLIERLENVSE